MTAIGFSVGLILYFVLTQAARKRGKIAYDTLEDAQKLIVVDAFTNTRMRAGLPGIVLVIGLVCGLHFLHSHALWVILGFFGLCFLWLVVVHRQIKAKLASLGLPGSYVTAVLKARRLSHLGVVLFVVCLFGGILAHGVWRAIQSDEACSAGEIVEQPAKQVQSEGAPSGSL